MKLRLFFLVLILPVQAHAQVPQKHLSRIDEMPSVPRPLKIINFKELARKFDQTVYDFNAKGKYWPLVWLDTRQDNFPQPVVGLYTAIGDIRQGPFAHGGTFHESLTVMGAVLGASLVGIEKSTQDFNYVGMLKNYFNRSTGWNIMQNNTNPEAGTGGGGYARDWWYDVYPNLLFYAVYDKYSKEPGFQEIAHSIADRFYEADKVLNGNYNYSYFDYGKMRPMKNGICEQPDVAAGHAWVLFSAFKKFGDRKYLAGAKSALNALESNTSNPSYEVLMPFGAYLSARLNAEEGTHYDVKKMLEWTFNPTAKCRLGWGSLVGRWNGFDISGIIGSSVDQGGYGFLMNTYDMAWPLVPLVRYDQSYAEAIGKWMLNAANASKLFYPEHMPANHQTLLELAEVTKGVIAYEGIIKNIREQTATTTHLSAPIAQGDGPLWSAGNPDVTQFSVYGSAHVGIFGSLIRKTNVRGILQLNLLATDFFRDDAYPTYLYYNPHNTSRTVKIPLESPTDLYDTVSGKFTVRGATGLARLKLAPKTAAVIVMLPTGGKITRVGKKLLVNGIVVDYSASVQSHH